jgi:hypothetical protein
MDAILAGLSLYALYKVFTNSGLVKSPAKPIFSNHRYFWSDDASQYFQKELHSYHNPAPETNISAKSNGVNVLASGPFLFEIGQFQIEQIEQAAHTGTNVKYVSRAVNH